jgi:hypothetical protein
MYLFELKNACIRCINLERNSSESLATRGDFHLRELIICVPCQCDVKHKNSTCGRVRTKNDELVLKCDGGTKGDRLSERGRDREPGRSIKNLDGREKIPIGPTYSNVNFLQHDCSTKLMTGGRERGERQPRV